MARKSRRTKKACRCGALTPNQHVEYVLAGYPTHTYSGPEVKR